MPTDLTLKTMNTVHRLLLKASGGRLGWNLSRMPALELTTTGRKSGQPRSVMLTSPYQDGTTIVVVASRGGDDTHPAWSGRGGDERRPPKADDRPRRDC